MVRINLTNSLQAQPTKLGFKKYVLLILAFMMMPFVNLYAETPSKLPSASIDTMYVSGGGRIGDTCVITARFTPTFNIGYKSKLSFSSSLIPLDSPDSLHSISASKVCAIDSTEEVQYRFIVTDTNSAIITYETEALLELPVEYMETQVTYGNLHLGERLCIIEFEESNDDRDLVKRFYSEDTWFNVGEQHFKISGKVTFREGTADNLKGAFNIVRLYFYSHPDDGSSIFNEVDNKLILPNPLNGNNYLLGTHYAQCDDKGEYSFDFKTNLSVKDLYVLVVVEKQNFAVQVFSPADHHYIASIIPDEYFRTFTDYSFKKISPYASEYDIKELDIAINPLDGTIFRYASLSKMFLTARFNVGDYAELPFNTTVIGDRIPRINVERINNTSDKPVGKYYDKTESNPVKILYQNRCTIPALSISLPVGIIHEYGHYVDDAMSSFDAICSNLDCDDTEAWAIFYTNAVSAWNNSKYNEAILPGDNAEIAPYYTFDDNGRIAERGHNLSINWRIGGYACFLWNLYDSKDEGVFTANNFTSSSDLITHSTKGFDNDDLEYGRKVFDWWIENPNRLFSEFSDYVIYQCVADNIKEQRSVLFMYLNFSSSVNCSQFPNPAKPNSVSVNQLEKTISIQSGSYPPSVSYNAYINYGNVLDDDGHLVTVPIGSTTWSFGNTEEGYLVEDASTEQQRGIIPFNNRLNYSLSNLDNTNLTTIQNIYSMRELDYDVSLCYNPYQVPFPAFKQSEMDNNELEYSINIYPNPCTSTARLTCNAPQSTQITIVLLNALGQVLNSNSVISHNSVFEYNLENYSSGFYTYVVKFVNTNNDVFTKVKNFVISK